MCFSLENAKHWLAVFRNIIEDLNEKSEALADHLALNEFGLKKSSGSLSSDCQSSEDSLDSLSSKGSDSLKELESSNELVTPSVTAVPCMLASETC